jgi:hypothetical protein
MIPDYHDSTSETEPLASDVDVDADMNAHQIVTLASDDDDDDDDMPLVGSGVHQIVTPPVSFLEALRRRNGSHNCSTACGSTAERILPWQVDKSDSESDRCDGCDGCDVFAGEPYEDASTAELLLAADATVVPATVGPADANVVPAAVVPSPASDATVVPAAKARAKAKAKTTSKAGPKAKAKPAPKPKPKAKAGPRRGWRGLHQRAIDADDAEGIAWLGNLVEQAPAADHDAEATTMLPRPEETSVVIAESPRPLREAADGQSAIMRGASSALALPKNEVVCSKCNEVCDPLRSHGKAGGRWKCGSCNTKLVQLHRKFGGWPLKEFVLNKTDEQLFFQAAKGKDLASLEALIIDTMTETLTESESRSIDGEWNPLSVWVARGYVADEILQTATSVNSKKSDRWGTIYKIETEKDQIKRCRDIVRARLCELKRKASVEDCATQESLAHRCRTGYEGEGTQNKKGEETQALFEFHRGVRDNQRLQVVETVQGQAQESEKGQGQTQESESGS